MSTLLSIVLNILFYVLNFLENLDPFTIQKKKKDKKKKEPSSGEIITVSRFMLIYWFVKYAEAYV